jgi:RNA polymerase sigma-70 factor (ECF subfamily)
MTRPSPLPNSNRSVARFPFERLSDAELVEAIAQGQAEAMGVVWDRYSGLTRSVLRASLGADAVVEDLLQEVFIGFLRGAERLRSGNSLRAYLVGIAMRLVMVELRRRRVRRWVTLSPTGEVPEGSSPPVNAEAVEALRALYRLLDRMPTRRRLAFVLRHVQGFEISEAARVLGVSESTLKREAARARASIVARAHKSEPSLRAYLGDEVSDDD